jgi:hypothetical protein
MNYDILTAEIKKAEYQNLTDREIVDKLNAQTVTKVVPRFGSFRTLANILTENEYNTFRTVLATNESTLILDMVKMLELPGDESGNSGGIDFGSESVRSKLDELVAASSEDIKEVLAAAAIKIKAIAEIKVSPAALLGLLNVELGHVQSARALNG